MTYRSDDLSLSSATSPSSISTSIDDYHSTSTPNSSSIPLSFDSDVYESLPNLAVEVWIVVLLEFIISPGVIYNNLSFYGGDCQ